MGERSVIEPVSEPAGRPLLHPGAFLQSLLPPLLIWLAMFLGALLGGFPGAACMTPMAWLLALWSGTQYALKTAGDPDRRPALAPILLGLLLGTGLGVIFIYGSDVMMAGEDRPSELAKALGLVVFVLVGGVIICPVLSSLTAWLTRRRLAK